MMRTHIPFPALPVPPSWYPGHMLQFQRALPTLLNKTDVVLELRDARLPLTSINRNFEGALQKWRRDRGRGSLTPTPSAPSSSDSVAATAVGTPKLSVCERVVVFSKRDLVPEWGIKPFQRAMANKYPGQRVLFASWNRARDIKSLSELLINIAKEHPYRQELNVLVVGMPNVGKSTLLNALRNIGIAGPTPKALRTSAQPGMTRVLSTRLKLSVDPLVYAYDSPGVMLPFLGNGEKGAERGIKLALIAGIKEGLYDTEALASYLLYRLNVLDPISPAYLQLLGPGTRPVLHVQDFLALLAKQQCLLQRGGVPDTARAATRFLKWWRDKGGLACASAPPACGSSSTGVRGGWGFDLEWNVGVDGVGGGRYNDDGDGEAVVQAKMEECMDAFEAAGREEEREGGSVSVTQERKRAKEAQKATQRARSLARLRR